MGFVPAVNTIQVELVYLWDSQVIETVLHYDAADPISPLEYPNIGAQMVTLWNANLKGCISTGISLTQIKITDMESPNGPSLSYGTGLPLAATLTGPALPNSCALCVTKRTILRGRSYRGRIYHPGLGEPDVTANVVSAARVSTILAAYEAIRSITANSITYFMCVVSKVGDGIERETAEITRVSSFTTDGLVDSQRRRLPGRGR